MVFNLATVGNSKEIDFFKRQLIDSIEEFGKLQVSENIQDSGSLLNIILVNQLDRNIKKDVENLKKPTLIILIKESEFVLKDNVYYATFSEEIRQGMISKGLKNVFLIPVSLNQKAESFEESLSKLDEDISNYLKKGISYYLTKPFKFYRNQFNSNAQYRQILKVLNLAQDKIRVANANMDYKYKPGERPE